MENKKQYKWEQVSKWDWMKKIKIDMCTRNKLIKTGISTEMCTYLLTENGIPVYEANINQKMLKEAGDI